MKNKASPRGDNATVYYDGACSLCNREIASIEKRLNTGSSPNHQDLHFVNVHGSGVLPEDKAVLLKNLHLYTASGDKLVGLDANIFMWRASGLAVLPYIVGSPPVYPVAKSLYRLWANLRFKRKYQ